jgi:hypothetical protein
VSDYDSPWKEALDRYFPLVLAFFFPEIFADIDWSRDYEALDQELQKLAPEGEVGRRRVDKLIKVYRKDTGDPVYLHIEVQSQEEEGFERRVYVYNYRIEDRYNQPVVSLVILGDDNPDWRPCRYVAGLWGCTKTFEFDTRKLLDWAGRLAELEASDSPFALLVLAHLRAQATRGDWEARWTEKVRLLKGLYDRKWEAEDVRHRMRFLDWLLDLPAGLERRVSEKLAQYDRERQMPFVTSFERVGMEKGLHKGIEAVLDIKFGAEGLALLSAVGERTADELSVLLDAIKRAATLDAVRALLSAPPQPGPAASETSDPS